MRVSSSDYEKYCDQVIAIEMYRAFWYQNTINGVHDFHISNEDYAKSINDSIQKGVIESPQTIADKLEAIGYTVNEDGYITEFVGNDLSIFSNAKLYNRVLSYRNPKRQPSIILCDTISEIAQPSFKDNELETLYSNLIMSTENMRTFYFHNTINDIYTVPQTDEELKVSEKAYYKAIARQKPKTREEKSNELRAKGVNVDDNGYIVITPFLSSDKLIAAKLYNSLLKIDIDEEKKAAANKKAAAAKKKKPKNYIKKL